MSSNRDDALRTLLPATGSEYSFDTLSEAETAALEAAFGDGFGDVGAVGYVPAPLPPKFGVDCYAILIMSETAPNMTIATIRMNFGVGQMIDRPLPTFVRLILCGGD